MNQIRFSKLPYVLLLFVLVACQVQATSVPTTASQPATAVPTTAPLPATAVPPTVAPTIVTPAQTTFSSKVYKLRMSVSFESNWHIIDDKPDLVTVAKKPAVKTNIVTNLGFNIVTDAKLADPVDEHLIPFPEDFVSWIQSDPDFEAGEEVEVMVGGIKGIQIDARSTITELKPYLQLPSGVIWYVSDGSDDIIWIWRFILLNDVNGEQVLITFPSPADHFQSELEESQKILDSIVFSKP